MMNCNLRHPPNDAQDVQFKKLKLAKVTKLLHKSSIEFCKMKENTSLTVAMEIFDLC